MPAKARATRDHHPSKARKSAAAPAAVKRTQAPQLVIPADRSDVDLEVAGRVVRLTNLNKMFWPDDGIVKRDLLQYYADVSPVLLPHLVDRAMVMKRYPNGATGDFFFMKRTPTPHPEWLATCSIEHGSGNVIDFPMVQDLPTLMWLVNLGCIDLNQWYARCDDVDRPDYLHFDLDPGPGANFEMVRATALLVRTALEGLGMKPFVKTTGSKGIHIYVAIVRGPTQKQVWGFAKQFAQQMAKLEPELMTAVYRIADRPADRVLVDYNQNAWGRTLASLYSPRPKPRATVSAPVTWDELEGGAKIDDFRIDNMRERIDRIGDLWAPLTSKSGRFDLSKYL
jgi:bifunctional non-homologous end joining protein LigD